MTKLVELILLFGLLISSGFAEQLNDSGPNTVVHVATALNHLTVLEFREPVTMAAAGSSEFQIEREANKVLVKPTKSGVATDLFVWTLSQRFVYELETTEEVKNMNFAIDSLRPASAGNATPSAPSDEVADIVLTRALLEAKEIKQARRGTPKNQVSVRVEQVFRTRSTIYVHYRIENNTARVYHVNSPTAHELQTDQPSVSLSNLVHSQIDKSSIEKLGSTQQVPLSVAHAENESQELEPGGTTQGVIAIRQDLQSPVVVQLQFDDDLKATVVL